MKFHMKVAIAKNLFFGLKLLKNNYFSKPFECRTKNLIFVPKSHILSKKDNPLPIKAKICLFWAKLAPFLQSDVKNFIFEICVQKEVFYSDFICFCEKIDIFCSKVKKVRLMSIFGSKTAIFSYF